MALSNRTHRRTQKDEWYHNLNVVVAEKLPSKLLSLERTPRTEGHILYNKEDELLYYSNGIEWLPIATKDGQGMPTCIIDPVDGDTQVCAEEDFVTVTIGDANGGGVPALKGRFNNNGAFLCGASADNFATAGAESLSSGDGCFALGDRTQAFGLNTNARGANSHAQGENTSTIGINAHAEGSFTSANGDNSHAEGGITAALGDNSHAEGNQCIASGTNSHAQGLLTFATAINSHAEGEQADAFVQSSHAHSAGPRNGGTAGDAQYMRCIVQGTSNGAVNPILTVGPAGPFIATQANTAYTVTASVISVDSADPSLSISYVINGLIENVAGVATAVGTFTVSTIDGSGGLLAGPPPAFVAVGGDISVQVFGVAGFVVNHSAVVESISAVSV